MSDKVLVYAGNMQGEVYIYEVTNLMEAFKVDDEEAQLPKAQLNLLDMILTEEPHMIRQMTQVGE